MTFKTYFGKPLYGLITVLFRYNEVGYSEQRDIVYTFRYFGWFAVELMLKPTVIVNSDIVNLLLL